eukprot:g67228.t1
MRCPCGALGAHYVAGKQAAQGHDGSAQATDTTRSELDAYVSTAQSGSSHQHEYQPPSSNSPFSKAREQLESVKRGDDDHESPAKSQPDVLEQSPAILRALDFGRQPVGKDSVGGLDASRKLLPAGAEADEADEAEEDGAKTDSPVGMQQSSKDSLVKQLRSEQQRLQEQGNPRILSKS